MKGGGVGSYSLSAKRGWRGGLAIAVLCLVIFSMLVPLIFLFGFHSSTGDVPEVHTSTSSSSSLSAFVSDDPGQHNTPPNRNQSKEDNSDQKVEDVLKRLNPSFSKDGMENIIRGASNTSTNSSAKQANEGQNHVQTVVHEIVPRPVPDTMKKGRSGAVEVTQHVEGESADETKKACQLEFGSYCLWRQEHKEEMKDKMVKKMKDLLFVARAYFPSIAKLPAHDKLSREMKQNIQEFERILSESTTDTDLPLQVATKVEKMEAVITKAKSFIVDCNNVDKKLRQILDMTEDEAHFHMKQSAFLYELAVVTMPKSFHCLSMRLTVEYFRSHSLDMDVQSEKYFNPELRHYVIFSNNILASSVVINSTVMHSKESANQVFHVLTDGENYFAMKLWFFRNSYKDTSIHVLNFEELNLEPHGKKVPLHLSFSEEFRISLRDGDGQPATQMKTEYISLFGHTHFLLPELFQTLKKVVVLDDDIVIQQDLSSLWTLDMGEKVIGAVQFCGLRLNQLKGYLGNHDYDGNSCIWMSGLNIVDLVSWREHDLTETYRKLLQVQNTRTSVREGALPASLLAFQGLVYALDNSLALNGLGHNYGIDDQALKKAAVLHYNGNMKPWLELGIPRYKAFWKRYLKLEDRFMVECNVNP